MTEAGQFGTWEEIGNFGLNQDTGGAITGPGRADVFWGNGPYAELAAGHLQYRGDMYSLILKPAVLPQKPITAGGATYYMAYFDRIDEIRHIVCGEFKASGICHTQ